MRQLTFESVEGEKINPFHLPPSHFLSLLAPPSSCSTSVAALTDANPLDLPQSALYALTLEKQIEKIMRKVGVARHSEILEFLEPEARRGDAALIEKIQVSATLVQGCWVLKSDLLYPTAALTTTTTPSAPHGTTHSYITTRRSAGRTSGRHNTPAGTPHKAMVDAREYALYLLSSQGWLELDKLQQMTPVPGTDMLAMLGAIARPQLAQGNNKSSGRWVFLLDRDDHFIEQHREVTQRYAMKWEYQFRTRIAPR
ncbi:DNA-directed RNA polymerase III subunit RPC5 [Hyalella azteca]|uniref:DNA-directed RNA polymerase III subunit RPC5 n=1 Tax=Hyalella azteca TaxID=294128 RepID=A0A8B7MZ65_HYAAZ|nr:DNA-directed RNA polymerase III subunit RPC5 [Hyalella azteca]